MAGDKYLFPHGVNVYYSTQPVDDWNVDWRGLDWTSLMLIEPWRETGRPTFLPTKPERFFVFSLSGGRGAYDYWNSMKVDRVDVRILVVFPRRIDQDMAFTDSFVGRVENVNIVKSELSVVMSSIEGCGP